VRSFRLDRVAHAVIQEGQFPVPGGFDPAAQVAEAVSGTSYRHAVPHGDTRYDMRELIRQGTADVASIRSGSAARHDRQGTAWRHERAGG
jgi:hypothetical protein